MKNYLVLVLFIFLIGCLSVISFASHTEPFVPFQLQSLTTAERDHLITSETPVQGMMIYNADSQQPEIWTCGSPTGCFWGRINLR